LKGAQQFQRVFSSITPLDSGGSFVFQKEICTTAYVIVDIDVTDSLRYEEYKKLAPPAVALYGGQYIARGGRTEVLEGDWKPNRLVILQFGSSSRQSCG